MEVVYRWNMPDRAKCAARGRSKQLFASPIFSAFGCQWRLKLHVTGPQLPKLSLDMVAYPPNFQSVDVNIKFGYTGHQQSEQTRSRLARWYTPGHESTTPETLLIRNLLELVAFHVHLSLVAIHDVKDNNMAMSYINTATAAEHEYLWEIDDQALVLEMKNAPFEKSFSSNKFSAFGCEWSLVLYPNGDEEQGFISLYLRLLSKPTNIKRVQIVFALQCLQRNFTQLKCAETFDDQCPSGYSKSSCLPTSELQNCESFTAKVNLELIAVYDVYDKNVTSALLNGELQQKQTVYELSKQNGDVVLTLQQEFQEPPAKKRRLDANGLDECSETEEKEVRVCSVLLRAASKIFDNAFASGTLERQTGKIEISAKTIKDLDDLWYFICTGYYREDSNVFELLRLAHMYDMKLLFKKCVDELMRSYLSVDTCVLLLLVFDKYEIKQDHNKLLRYAEKNSVALKKRKDFLRLSYSLRQYILRSVKE